MVFRVFFSPYMDKQVSLKPPDRGFETYDKAYKWVLEHYGSTAIDNVVAGVDMGCHIVED